MALLHTQPFCLCPGGVEGEGEDQLCIAPGMEGEGDSSGTVPVLFWNQQGLVLGTCEIPNEPWHR